MAIEIICFLINLFEFIITTDNQKRFLRRQPIRNELHTRKPCRFYMYIIYVNTQKLIYIQILYIQIHICMHRYIFNHTYCMVQAFKSLKIKALTAEFCIDYFLAGEKIPQLQP